MFSFLNKKYDELGIERFRKIGPIVCLLSDILVVYYMINIQLPSLISPEVIQMTGSIQGLNLSVQDAKDFADFAVLQFGIVFLGFILFHTFVYTMAFLKKPLAIKYISNYTFFGVLLTVLEVVLVFVSEFKISLFTFISLIGYFFVWYGYKKFFKKSAPQN